MLKLRMYLLSCQNVKGPQPMPFDATKVTNTNYGYILNKNNSKEHLVKVSKSIELNGRLVRKHKCNVGLSSNNLSLWENW